MNSVRKYCTVLFCLLVLGTQAGCEEGHKRSAKIYIPDGYVGWVLIEYGVKGASELPTDFLGPWEYQYFPKSGLLQTSSPLKDGAASADYFYYSGNDVRPLPYEMVNGGAISWGARRPDGSRLPREFVTEFIGPKDIYEMHKDELERFRKSEYEIVISSLDDLPKVGNIRER